MRRYKMNRGWYNNRPDSNPKFESYRHRLARYGIKTKGLTQNEIKRKHDRLMNRLEKEKKKERFVTDRKDREDIRWIQAVLVNDENSTDEELKEYFMTEGNMSKEEAKHYVKQRDDALRKPLKFKLEKYGGE